MHSEPSLPPTDRLDWLADAVHARRQELGLTRKRLAELAGCSLRFVHTLENGKTTVRLDKALDVLDVLGLELRVETRKVPEK